MLMLRRIMWQKLPKPIAEVSPSPETPIGSNVWFAKLAPVATADILPWTALKPNDWLKKYAGVFDEQPMPLSLTTLRGSMLFSKKARWTEAEIASWPQPRHMVDGAPS